MAYRKSAFWDHLKYVKSNEQKNEGDNRYHRWRTQAVWTKKPPHSNVICQLENKCKDPNQFYYSWNLFVWRFSTNFLENSLSQTGHLNFFLMSISLWALTWCRFKSDFLLNVLSIVWNGIFQNNDNFYKCRIVWAVLKCAGSCGLFSNVPVPDRVADPVMTNFFMLYLKWET